MSPKAQRISIAESCGWAEIQTCGSLQGRIIVGDNSALSEDDRNYPLKSGKYGAPIPNYLNDLNAMAEAVSYLRNSNRLAYAEYAKNLEKIVAIYNSSEERQAYHAIQVCDATAAHRADAFILALSLKPSA